MKTYVCWKTAMLAVEKGFAEFNLKECDSGFNPHTGQVIEGEAWRFLVEYATRQQHYPRPEQWQLQEWLREEYDVQIDMFYQEGGYSGRVFRLGDPERRWQSCTTQEWTDTLETMLLMGLAYIDVDVEFYDRTEAWAASIKEALEHHD